METICEEPFFCLFVFNSNLSWINTSVRSNKPLGKIKVKKGHTKYKSKIKCFLRFRPIKLYFSNVIRINRKKNYIKLHIFHWKYTYRQIIIENSYQSRKSSEGLRRVENLPLNSRGWWQKASVSHWLLARSLSSSVFGPIQWALFHRMAAGFQRESEKATKTEAVLTSSQKPRHTQCAMWKGITPGVNTRR